MSTYSFHDHKKTAQIRILDIASGDSQSLVEEAGASEPVWLSDDEVLYLKSGSSGSTSLIIQRVGSPESS